MKEWNIDKIQSMTEKEAQEMALETMLIKDHNIYFVDFGDRFGYSILVFNNGHHIYYVNDYELHHRGNSWCKGKTKAELRDWYIKRANNKLFTEEEIIEPIKDYDEYNSKSYFLHNYYGSGMLKKTTCNVSMNTLELISKSMASYGAMTTGK